MRHDLDRSGVRFHKIADLRPEVPPPAKLRRCNVNGDRRRALILAALRDGGEMTLSQIGEAIGAGRRGSGMETPMLELTTGPDSPVEVRNGLRFRLREGAA